MTLGKETHVEALESRFGAIWGRRKEISIMNTVPMTPTRQKARIRNDTL